MNFAQHSILVVDDEPSLLFSLKAYLEDKGYFVQSTSSGEEALEKLCKQHFDAVIIDIRLPCKDGSEVIFEAKKAGCKAHFLIHTGSNDYQIPTMLHQFGMSQEDIFFKPLPNLEIFHQALRKRIKKM